MQLRKFIQSSLSGTINRYRGELSNLVGASDRSPTLDANHPTADPH